MYGIGWEGPDEPIWPQEAPPDRCAGCGNDERGCECGMSEEEQ